MGSVRLPTGELLYPQGQGMNTPRLKKLYLIMILSTICIFFFQYHISRAQLDEQPVQEVLLPDALVDQKQPLPKGAIVRHQEPMRELLLADSSSSGQQVTRDESNDAVNSPPIFPPIYVITPTFRRAEQLAEITRLGYTLKHVPNLHWLVMEDSNTTTPMVTKLLVKIGVPFTHLVAPMPAKYKKNKIKPRGVSNRNRGLQWIRKNATDGVIYFADDDNSYDVSLFEEIRYTKKIAMFPVGLVTSVGVSSPIVVNGTITGFYDGWIAGRKYPVDMAGFAVNVKFFLERPKAKMPYTPGYEEDGFLKSLHPFDLKDIQIFANNCTEILVWHTQTKKNAQAAKLDYTKYNGTNIIALRDILW